MSEKIDSSLADKALAGSGFLGRLDPISRKAVLAMAEERTFAAGEVLFHQGDVGDSAFLIVEGELEVAVDTSAGPVEMAVLGPHQLVGEMAVFGRVPRSATVTARSSVRALRLERDDVMSIVAAAPATGVAIIADLGQRLSAVNQPLAFLSMAAQALKQDRFDTDSLAALSAQAKGLGSFARSFQEMIREIEAKHRRRQDMAMATRIQQSILPPAWADGDIPDRAPVLLHAMMRPSRDVGGDLYDYFFIDEGHLAVVVADVSGKGVPAALFMAMFRTAVRAVAMPGMSVEQVLERTNAILAGDNEASMFVTAFFGILHLDSGWMSYVNAGHNPPYRLPAAGGRDMLPAGGAAVAMLDHPGYASVNLALGPDDLLFVYTDGITEAFDEAGRQYGEARLEALLEGLRDQATEAVVAAVVADVDGFVGDFEQSDDITCLALVYRPSAARRG